MKPSPASLPPPPPGLTGWPWDCAPEPPGSFDASSAPRITLITPSFNQGAFIEETIRSVLLQGYPNLEYIIIDGGSTDATVAIIQKYAPWLSYWTSERDRGQSDAINKGLVRATGEWTNWLNSDDFLQPGALRRLVQAAGPGETARIVAGSTVNIRDGAAFGRYAARVPQPPDTLFQLGVNQPGSLLRLADVRAAGGVREDLGLCMDLDLWQRILGARGEDCVRLIDDEVASYRYHVDSKTCRETDPFALEEYALLFDLAVSLGARLPASFATLRAAARFSAQPPSVPLRPPSPAEAETALLNRLIVRDSLLFRALCKQNPEPATLRTRFLRLLDDAGELLALRFPDRPPAHHRAASLIAAAQSLPRFSAGFYGSAVRARPSLATLADTLRALLRR